MKMKYEIKRTSRFKKDYKLILKRKHNPELLGEVVKILASGEELPPKYNDHALKGEYAGCRECHISPDWLLIYEIDENVLYLYLSRTGTHSDLF